MTDVVVYANVKVTLGKVAATRALGKVLGKAGHADVIGLGEWGRSRASILHARSSYDWRRPLRGGGPLGLDRTRYRVETCRARKLIGRTQVEPDPGNPRRTLPTSWCTEVVAYDQILHERVTFLLYHLTAGIQGGDGRYKTASHPQRVARHQAEVRALEALVARHQEFGRTVYALGDSNYDGLTLRGLTSAWAGHNDAHGGDLGRRRVSDVFGPGDAAVQLVSDGSDHRGMIARRRRT